MLHIRTLGTLSMQHLKQHNNTMRMMWIQDDGDVNVDRQQQSTFFKCTMFYVMSQISPLISNIFSFWLLCLFDIKSIVVVPPFRLNYQVAVCSSKWVSNHCLLSLWWWLKLTIDCYQSMRNEMIVNLAPETRSND